MDVETLRESARLHMRRALHAWCNADHDMAVLHGGIAFEHITKAGLAARHPSLLADGRDFPTLLHAAGLGSHAPNPLTAAKTLGALEAFKRAMALIPMPVTERDVQPLLNARNGVAHLGMHDVAQTGDALAVAVKVIDVVLADIGEGDADFWGPYRSSRSDLPSMQRMGIEGMRKQAAVEALADAQAKADEQIKEDTRKAIREWHAQIEEERSVAEQVFAVKIHYAKKLYRIAKKKNLHAAQLKKLANFDEVRKWSRPDECDTFYSKCPVCGYNRGIIRAAIDEDGDDFTDSNVRLCHPNMYDCPVCGLELDGWAELSMIGVSEHYYVEFRNGRAHRFEL
ncbi:hypothetical protein HEP87_18430 [Streptomyces sp. S1D4-11]|nr:hypothetical protein [Streptomyces sp. S1D4-11]QIY95650.1 hypothetical protein HEP87_18430 [Streptomyces sp. S1D4-11]